MTRVVIIDSKSIKYSDNALRGENVDWFDVNYDEDNIRKIDNAILAEVRDGKRGTHVIDSRHWHEMPEKLQRMWVERGAVQ